MRVILTVTESPPAVLTVPAESAATLTAETYISVDTTTPSVDGNELEYGLTDGTLPIVGVAKVGSAEI